MRTLFFALLLSLPTAALAGSTDAARDAVLKRLFPAAERFAAKDVLLSDEMAARLAEVSKARVGERMVTFYTATRGGQAQGHVVFHSHRVRTKTETLAVVFEADGRLRQVDILVFLEPSEYRPSEQWLAQLRGKGPGAHLKVGDDLDGITGATLSARGIAEQARWLLHAFQLLPKAPTASVTK